MKVDIYRSEKDKSKFLSVPSGFNVTTLSLPPEIDKDLLKLVPFKKGLELDPTKPRIALDEADVQKQIEDKGYAVHAVASKIEINP